MTPQELKNSILQLAIQGKLVEQRPEEGTAEELYQKIQEEKKRLIKEGKIKKEKPLPEITEDEVPFEIPESWKWVRLGDCSNYAQRKEKISANIIKKEEWSLDLEDIEKETGRILQRHLASERKIAGDKVKFYKGQVLYSKLRPYLKKVLVAPDNGICSSEIVPFFMYGNINPQYIVYVLICPHVDYMINSVTYGVKMPRVGTETMVNLLVPLPPLAEQKRIVAKIEELLPYIDRYEQAWNRLEAFNKRFPLDMQKSLLQWAIQGKLVEQRTEEGTAEELYQQIQEEKSRLIKEGKIKKEKPLPEIAEDEVPFEIPKSWKWVRIGQILGLQAGKNITAADIYEQKSSKHSYPCYGGNGLRGFVSTYNREGHFALIGRQGALCGNINFADGRFYATEHAVVVEHYGLSDVIWSGWFLHALNLNQYATATAQPGLAVANIVKIPIPLPPLAEQKRIVDKLEELLPLCERLK